MNKKGIAIIVFVFAVLCLGATIVISSQRDVQKEPERQVETDGDSEKSEEQEGLQMKEDGKDKTEDITDASGTWDASAEPDETDNQGTVNESATDVGSGDSDDGSTTSDSEETILEDDISWGEIY